MSSKLYHLKAILSELQFDDVSVYSVTSHFIADHMTKILLFSWQFYHDANAELHILDGMAAVGLGNTFSFLDILSRRRKYYIYINERDQKRYRMLKNNVNTLIENHYIRYCNNIFLYNHDINKLHYFLDYDLKLSAINILFLDPEWGGSKYRDQEKLRLKIGDHRIERVINLSFQWYKNLQIIALKLPLNYDWKYFKDSVNVKHLLLMQINFVNQALVLCIKYNCTITFNDNQKFCAQIANSYFPNISENVRILV